MGNPRERQPVLTSHVAFDSSASYSNRITLPKREDARHECFIAIAVLIRQDQQRFGDSLFPPVGKSDVPSGIFYASHLECSRDELVYVPRVFNGRPSVF